MATDKQPLPVPDDEWADATAAFQKMLEVMPDDLLALESLFEAYLNQGELPKALHYLERLVRVLLKENERSIAEQLHEKLMAQVATIPEFTPFAIQLEPLLQRKEVAPARRADQPAMTRKADIQGELSLAWRLFQDGIITQEDYAQVVQDLTEVSTRKTDVPVTVLHALNDRGSKQLEKVLIFLAKESGLPLIRLGNFEIPHALHTVLPMEIMGRWGALVFGTLGQDLLIAVLNPFDQVLQGEISALTGKVCHFYLTTATDYDKALANIRKALAEAAKASA